MAEQLVIDLLIQDKSAMSISEMRKQVKELQSELANLDPNSAEFERVSKAAAEMRDSIDDANDAVNNMKGDPIESLKGNFEGLGTSVKNLDFEGATRKLNAMGSSIKNINFGSIAKQVGQMGGAFLKMAGQLAATLGPLALIAGAVALVVAGFNQYNDVMKKVEETEAEYNKTVRDTNDAIDARIKLLDKEYNQLELNNEYLNGEYTEVEFKVEKTKREHLDKFVEAKAQQFLELQKLNEDFQKRQQAEDDRYNSIAGISREEHLKRAYAILNQYKADEKKLIEKHNEEILKLEKIFGEKIETIYTEDNKKEVKAASDKWASMNKSADDYFKSLQEKYYGAYYRAITGYDEELAKYNEYLANKLWTQAQYDEAIKMLAITHKKEMDAIETTTVDELSPEMKLTKEAFDFWLQKQIEKQALAEKYATETIGLENELEAYKTGQYAKDIASFNWSADLKLEKLKWFYENGKIQEQHYNDAVYQVQMQRLDNYKAVNDTMAGISTSFFDFLTNLSEGNEKKQKKIKKAAFNINKATSAVETGIDTTQAIMKIAAEIPPPFSIPLQIATGIQGALAVAAILSKKFPEDGNAQTGGGGTAPSTAGTTPSVANMYGSGGGTPTTFQSLSPANQPIQKVVVLESDISSAQQNVAKVGVQSTF